MACPGLLESGLYWSFQTLDSRTSKEVTGQMKSPSLQISYRREELAERLAGVMQASRTIRSEAALTICESIETRLVSRQLRMESQRTSRRRAAGMDGLRTMKAQQRRWMAQAIAQVLSSGGYIAFVSTPPQDTVLIQ